MNEQSHPTGALMLDLEGISLTTFEAELLQRPSVGGLILFARNYQSPQQLADLISAIRQSRPEILIAVDQEGGRVQRFQQGFTRLPPLFSLGRRYREDQAQALALARQCGWLMAVELLQFGIDISFAPVLDLYNANSRVIAERAFSGDVASVTALALAYIAGMHGAGMAATGKHYPGHGSVAADSHVELPTDSRSAAEILQKDFRVFANCVAQLDGIMPAHVRYPAVDDACAGYSTQWLQDKLRGELGFDGVIFSDDLTMAAAHTVGSVEQRAEQALAAGCDMVLVCNDRNAAVTVANWLEAESHPGSKRLGRMRAQADHAGLNLQASEEWASAVRAAQSLLNT
jgi:beta-N-acetylhexosaminidase